MLDRLSPEILLAILEQVEARRKTLYACSLVSQVIKEVAQPLLWRFVSLGHNNQQPFVEMSPDLAPLLKHTRRLSLYGYRKKNESSRSRKIERMIRRIFGTALNLKDVVLRCSAVEESVLLALSKLSCTFKPHSQFLQSADDLLLL
jgi:hypothetical protein